MLSYVGSDIDEIQMDNLTFLKLQSSVLGRESELELMHMFETDLNNSLLLSMVEPATSHAMEMFIGLENSNSQ